MLPLLLLRSFLPQGLRFLVPLPLMVGDVLDMVWGGQSQPTPPDYTGAAKATGDSGVQAAIVNQLLNRPNETTPYGTRMWNQTGSTDVPGVGGQAGFSLPTYGSSIMFTPEGQKLFDMSNLIKNQLMQQGSGTLGQVKDALGQPLDFSKATQAPGQGDLMGARDQVTKSLFDRGMRLLQPQFDTESDRTRSDLVTRGFSLGNEGYTKAFDDVDRRQGAQRANLMDTSIAGGDAALSSLANTGLNLRRQDISEILAKRQMPLSELSSLTTGGAPTAPQFQPFSATANAAPTNYLSADQLAGQFDLANYGLNTQRMNMEAGQTMDLWQLAAGGPTARR